ncbi:FAD:protein FMN transferase [Methylotenera versatilis]|uniref:FAD:protein FMN transferase n=1 Tax=Methylotenera versatilis TaxID=1055487 RepID=UPI00064757C9|nr:FAD:protein FMN transferase [Methylotenera versatilis]
MRRVLIPQNLQTLPPQLPKGEQHTITGQSMGTTWAVRYINTHQQSNDAVHALIQHELDLVVAQMSTWQEDSNLSVFNRADANTWHVLPASFFAVLDCALKVAAETNGAFDPTIGPLVNLWGFGPEGQRTSPPDTTEVKALHTYCGWQKIKLDSEGMRALQAGNVYVDFSGIAKGYSVDRIARALQNASIENYLIEVGGELYGAGIKPDGQPWWIALETSPDATSVTESVVALHGLAVATSGDYRRYFEHHGQHYAHTIDPRTGFPIDRASNALVSVTVLHAECMVADALATAFTVMGVDAALAYAKQKDIAALLIEHKADGFKEHFSPQLMAMME